MADANLVRQDFYVYVLFRHDTGEPFYIGKGRGNRINTHHRDKTNNNLHRHRVAQLAVKAGVDIPRVKIAENLSEDQAFHIEIAFIAALGRYPNGPLTNITSGGDGIRGLGKKPRSETHRKRLSEVNTGKTHSAEARARMSISGKNRKPPSQLTREKLRQVRLGRKMSPETLEKMRVINLGKRGPVGCVRSPELRARISAKLMGHPGASKGQKRSPETCEKIREAFQKRKTTYVSPMLGRRHSEETKAKMREAAFRRHRGTDTI